MEDKFHIEENLKLINEEYPEDYEYQRDSLSVLNFFKRGLSKSQIKEIAENAIDNVLRSGNPLLVAEALAGMSFFVDEVKKNEKFLLYTREETAKYPKGFVSQSGAKIENIEVGTKYEYDQCNDPVLVELEKVLEEVTNEIKIRKDFLKTVPQSGIIVTDKETGETSTLYPPSKSSTSSYKVTLAR